jgi:hypothetical protein
MAICLNTGLTIPECSCSACLEDQLRREQPSLLTARVHEIESDEAAASSPQRHRPAA